MRRLHAAWDSAHEVSWYRSTDTKPIVASLRQPACRSGRRISSILLNSNYVRSFASAHVQGTVACSVNGGIVITVSARKLDSKLKWKMGRTYMTDSVRMPLLAGGRA